MSLTHQGGTPVSKIRSLKRKLYFEDEPKAAENPNDPAIKVAPIQVLKKLSIEQPVQEKPVKILKKTEPVLEDSLENSLNEYLANHAVTYLPPIDLINKVSNSPELKSDIKAQEIKLENPKVTFNIAFDADED